MTWGAAGCYNLLKLNHCLESVEMTVREVVLVGNDILREKARRVRDFDQNLHELLDDMLETMHEYGGVGLAAPQVGVSERVIVIQLPDNEEDYGPMAGQLFEVVNPEVVKEARETVEGVEGCLSIPGYVGNVERSTAVIVRAQDRDGTEYRVKAYDWLARVFLHEIDHLHGILYIDRTEQIWEVGKEPEIEEGAAEAEGK
ncbi:MAG: peptide deformylase [Anaerolineae bacterium]|nr:peptide deformylase [Anaerolineae bacterium]